VENLLWLFKFEANLTKPGSN